MGLQQQVLSGLKWTAFAKFGGQLITWAITIIVMRLLSPSDYGLMALASAIVALLTTIAEFGLGAALVQARELSRQDIKQIFGAAILLNMTVFAILLLSAPLIATFFEEVRLSPIIQAASLQFVIIAVVLVPDSRMRRQMQFKLLAIVDVSLGLTAGVITLLLALADFGVWSLVLGNLSGATLRAVLLLVLTPEHLWPSFSLRGINRLLSFGGFTTLSRILWHFLSQADIFIAGKFLGKEALGFYSVSMYLASLPMQKMMIVFNQVAFPAVARIQDQKEIIAEKLLKSLRLIAYFLFPVLWGLSAISPELVNLLLGEKWEAAIVPLQLVSLVVPVRMAANILSTVTSALGRADIDLYNTLTGAVIMPCAMLVGVQWGINGLATAWVFAVPIVFLLNFHRASAVIGINLAQLVRTFLAPAMAAGIMLFVAIPLCRSGLSGMFNQYAHFAILVVIGAAIYLVLASLLDRNIWRETCVFVASFWKK